MNGSSPQATALIRGLYLAAGMFALGFLTVWATTDEYKAPIISGGIMALGALGFRTGLEGRLDQKRDRAGNVLPGDVTPN